MSEESHTFRIPPRRVRQRCPQCGEETRMAPEEQKCPECQLYDEQPERAPGYWTWTKTTGGWSARTWLRENDPPPQPGTEITVHRQDGSSSVHTTREIRGEHYDRTARRTLTVDVC